MIRLSAIVSMEWVKEHGQAPDVVLVDCRFTLGRPDAGKEAYAAGHLPDALYFDLEHDLSAPKSEHGGRHPLPDWNEFARMLGEAGIDTSVKVVAYDDQGSVMASRLWWMLRVLGHEQAYVMDGGFSAWREAGYPVTDAVPQPQPRTFTPRLNTDWIAGMDEVKGKLGNPNTLLIDSREPRRYLGLEEAIDPVAGHIPGAWNRFWKEALDADGHWKNVQGQRERFADIPPSREVIVYCGSGVSATPNVLALREAGFRNVKLYAGSWSDWISYKENPIATGEE